MPSKNRNGDVLVGFMHVVFTWQSGEVSMTEMEQARRAGGSGKAFTAAVVLAIAACAAAFVWRFLF
jgi:trimethylamine:corrinoid methyltransferase-like protein